MSKLSFTARFRKQNYAIELDTVNITTAQLASAIACATGADAETIKLLMPGRKGALLRLAANPSQPALEAGKPSVLQCCPVTSRCQALPSPLIAYIMQV